MRYLYIGKKNEKDKIQYIYCDEIHLRFYAVDELIEDDGLEYIYELMPNDYEDENMRAYRITDSNLIKALTIALKIRKAMEIKTKQIEEHKKTKEKIRVKEAKKLHKKLILVLSLIVLYSSIFTFEKIDEHISNKHQYLVEKALTEEQQFENYDTFGVSLIGNKTISDDMREILFADFNRLSFSNIPILEKDLSKITKRIDNYDFTGLDRTNYLNALEYIIFGNHDSIANKCFISSLDQYANGELDKSLVYMFGELTIPLKINVPDKIFDDDEKFKKYIAESYNVSKDKIDFILYILECYANSTDELEKKNYYTIYQRELASLFSIYYQNKEELSEFDRIVLASQIFGGDYYIDNNIFNKYIKVTHSSKEYTSYAKYYAQSTKEDVSMLVYQEKLEELIKNKGTYLDYSDPDCRFLLYLYTLCYKDNLPYYNNELLNVKSPDELANLIVKRVFDTDGYVFLKKEFLYNYFTCGKINPDDIKRIYESLDNDALSVSLYVDVINCLKMEESIESNYYSGYLNKALSFLECNNEELYKEAKLSLETGESLFDNLSFFPAYQSYKSENVKKYIREQKTEEE